MVSFDVFDTLLTRKTAMPEGIFYLIQDKLQNDPKYDFISSYVRMNFCRLRSMAEKLVRLPENEKGRDDVTLRQIYSGMAMCGCLSEKDTAALYRLECETELENILPIKKNIQKVRECLAQGEHVILISDMYLEAEVVADMLKKADPFLAELPLYVSSSYQKAKWSGRLYTAAAQMEHVDYREWRHFGDQQKSDVEVPGRLGITACRLEAEPLMECEKALLDQEKKDACLQLLVGAGRYARILREYGTPGKIGSSFGGEILLPYVLWILGQCRERRIRRLYFVARDGYLLKKIADSIIKYNNLDISTEYIYGSRRAWRIPAMVCEAYEWNLVELIRWSHVEKIKTVVDLAAVLELPAEEFTEYLPMYYQTNPQHLLNSFELKLLTVQLQQNESFQDYFRSRHRTRMERAERYLLERIDMSDDNFAFVEIGGSGLTQDCLSILLQKSYHKKIKTFYFKLDRVADSKWCDFYAFMPSIFRMNRLIEMICRAPHEQTVDYAEGKNGMQPVFEGNETEALLAHGFDEFEAGLMGFVDSFLELAKTFDQWVLGRMENSNMPSMFLMEYGGEHPDRELLEYLADMPTSETGKNDVAGEVFAPVLSRQDIWNIFWEAGGKNIERFYRGSELRYSLLRCSPEDLDYMESVKRQRQEAEGRERAGKKGDAQTAEREEIVKRIIRNLSGKVSVYGAGKYGKMAVEQIDREEGIQLMHWWDSNAVSLRSEGYQVEMPGTVDDSCGIILVAVADGRIVSEIIHTLLEHGAKREKIVTIIRDMSFVYKPDTKCWDFERIFEDA